MYDFEEGGFPVAIVTGVESDSVTGELYAIPYNEDKVLEALDYIEGVGILYNRNKINIDNKDVYFYAGVENYWENENIVECNLPYGKKW